jgi:hypothetical protein
MTTTMLPVMQVLTTTVDVLLADVAIRVQLSPTAYDKAVARHDAIKRWIERRKSPLAWVRRALLSAEIDGDKVDDRIQAADG